MQPGEQQPADHIFLARAVVIALEAEARAHLPVGAVIVLDGEIIAEGSSRVPGPPYHPGRHAEITALDAVEVSLWPRAREMSVYSTLEPCVMCFSTCLLHGIGRIVFGATDTRGGARFIRPHLPPYYAQADGSIGGPQWVGPLDPESCDPLYERVHAAFSQLPCGLG